VWQPLMDAQKRVEGFVKAQVGGGRRLSLQIRATISDFWRVSWEMMKRPAP
jgi:hypothetical protein